MSSDEVTNQKLVAKAASLLKKAPMLTVPQGMHAANLSSAQSTNPALQMRVHCMLSNPRFAVDAPPTNVDITSPMHTISILSSPPVDPASISSAATTLSSADGTSSSIAKPKLDAIWLTSTGKAKEVSNSKRLMRHTVGGQFGNLTVVELDTLLRWHNQYSGKMTKQEKVFKLMATYQSNLVPAPIEDWTADDEGKLQRLKCNEIDLADTAVGRKQELMRQQFRAGGPNHQALEEETRGD